jgi:hypothetical protein
MTRSTGAAGEDDGEGEDAAEAPDKDQSEEGEKD